VLNLLAACQKYEMASVQSFIRAEVSSDAFPVPKKTEAFGAYAIASAKKLIPEMENAARLTLEHPMTFESLGEGLRMFEGRALRDLFDFRRRCRDKFITCLDPTLVLSGTWVGCLEVMSLRDPRQERVLPIWLNKFLTQSQSDLELQKVTCSLNIFPKIHVDYHIALAKHATCISCLRMHLKFGLSFIVEIHSRFQQARTKVTHSSYL
jgi:hypothetical protein